MDKTLGDKMVGSTVLEVTAKRKKNRTYRTEWLSENKKSEKNYKMKIRNYNETNKIAKLALRMSKELSDRISLPEGWEEK